MTRNAMMAVTIPPTNLAGANLHKICKMKFFAFLVDILIFIILKNMLNSEIYIQ